MRDEQPLTTTVPAAGKKHSDCREMLRTTRPLGGEIRQSRSGASCVSRSAPWSGCSTPSARLPAITAPANEFSHMKTAPLVRRRLRN